MTPDLTDVTRIGFDPFLGWTALWLAVAVMAFAWGVYLARGGRAWLTRGLALSLLAGALANPALVREEREPLPSVAAIILDRSESMGFGTRSEAAEVAYRALANRLEAEPGLELRLLESERRGDGTNLYSALEGLLADVPRDQIAGAILVTDGQIHDLPDTPDEAVDLGPIHGIIVGDPDRGDRRIEIVEGPSYGIVGETAEFLVRVDDPRARQVTVSVSVNGGTPQPVIVEIGRDTPVTVEIERRGANMVLAEVPPGLEELTLANNRTAASLAGVRDRLRVLLVTGRPNAAGRVWRDLLKSDPQVDLVHFTILRPPHKIDVTPIEEMALIQFPTEELFEEKLGGFDLIIFDQYERRGVITQTYLANMARYVDEGGALMIAAGEPYAGPASLARTPLAAVLPAIPTGRIKLGAFTPALTEAGRRHAVSAPLDGEDWGEWLRAIEARADAGDVLMNGPDGAPLLVLDRVGEGRVGLLLSDQIWLWARGHDGGGPFAELIRRIVHWMMKEPELEERRLDLIADGETARIRLRTLADSAPPLTLETPEGGIIAPQWRAVGPGTFEAEAPIGQLGLYRAEAGGLEAVALNGPANPKEYADLRSSPDVLAPVAEVTRGGIVRVGESGQDLPEIRRVGPRANAAGAGWLGLRDRGAYAVRSSTSQTLLPGLAAAMTVLILLLFAWRREGR